jgi:hypothetical protein
MRSIIKRIRNASLWDKPYVVNNHGGYRKVKRFVNKQLRRSLKKEMRNEANNIQF